jgi:hypothetical protein
LFAAFHQASVWQGNERNALAWLWCGMRYIAKWEYCVVPDGPAREGRATHLEVHAPYARGRAATAMEQDRYRAWLAPLHALQPDVGMVLDYVPATEDQLRLTEARLGFALPAALRAVYALVANGGDVFRDGYVLYGSVGGYPRDYSGAGVATIDQLVSRSGWRLNAHVDAALQRHPGAYVQCDNRPDRFVSIADLGCSQTAELDGWTGRLYVAGCGQDRHFHRVAQGLAPLPGSEDEYLVTLQFFAPSVEAWIDRKLTGGWMADLTLRLG